MIGRGGGKKMSNRSIIAPGRLQYVVRSSPNNLGNADDAGIVAEIGTTKSALTKRVQNGPSIWYDSDDVEMVTKNLDRQRASSMLDRDVESPTLSRTNLEHVTNRLQQTEDEQSQEEQENDCQSEGFVNDSTKSLLGERKRMIKLAELLCYCK